MLVISCCDAPKVFEPAAWTSGWRTRASLIRFVVLPSPACMGWSHRIPHWSMLPLFYVYRPFRYAGTRVYGLIFPPPTAERN